MRMQEIKEIAKSYGIKPAKLTKEKLIKEIQISEGNFDCFASAVSGFCDQQNCIWRDDCFTLAKKKNLSN